MNLRAVIRDVEPFETFQDLVGLVRPDAKGEMEEARCGLWRIFGILQEEVETVISDLDQRMGRATRLPVFFIKPPRSPDLTAENLLVKLHRALEVFYHKSQMIHFGLHLYPPF